MQKIIFSGHKQKIAEFDVEEMQFERQDNGLLLTASGTMVAQDTPSVENMMNAEAPVHITIIKDDETVIDQSFQVTVFAFEADNLAVLLQ